MKMLHVVMLFTFIACSATPKKPFKTRPFLPIGNVCFERLLDDDTIETVCMDEDDTFIGMKLKDLQKELDYQDELISRCRKWRR